MQEKNLAPNKNITQYLLGLPHHFQQAVSQDLPVLWLFAQNDRNSFTYSLQILRQRKQISSELKGFLSIRRGGDTSSPLSY